MASTTSIRSSQDPSMEKTEKDAHAGQPKAMEERFGYRPDIDGLRGFGAFLVIWFHFNETWNESTYKGRLRFNEIFSNSNLG